MRMNSIMLPRQRLSYRQKTKEWRKDNLDYADKHSFYNNERVRQSLKNKIINLNLYNGIVDVRDLTNIVNPNQIDATFIPDNIPHHPILVPKVDLLVGEETKRRFDWKVVVTNPDAVSKKEEEKKEYLMQRLAEIIQEQYSDEELEGKMKELEKYMRYNWQDLREKMANQILLHYWEEQKFGIKFVEGFKDALIMAEEIYRVEVIHDEPVLEKLNPLKVYSVRSGNSNKIEDSSIIIIEDHWSPNKIVDIYHDQLKPADIDDILEYSTTSSKGSYSDDADNHTLLRDALNTDVNDVYDTIFDMAEINGHVFSNNYTDENGNVRVLQVYWKSLKKIKKVKYYDELGETQFKIMSEEYTPIKELGEEVTDLWVNEWWEGVKIGKDIYVNMIPCRVQYNKMNNPSYCHPGIIGQIYNTNQGKAVSLVDRGKNYQYMYNAVWDRLNKAIATNYGKIANIDLASIPDGWEIEKWMHFAIVNKIAFRDSFKEGSQGAATGKLAGSFNNGQSSSIDMETGAYIQQHMQLLEFIKMEMGDVMGITKQREGQISNRETVGGVERSVNQSSHITELWFLMHEDCKIRVLTAFLEAAKIALKGNNKKVQYILDDQTIEILNIDGEEFSECDYGLLVSSSPKIMEMEQLIKELSQSFVQNGGSLSTIMDIYLAPSLLDMKHKLEEAEEKMQEQQSEQAKAQNEMMQQQMEQEQANKEADRQLDDLKNERDNLTKWEIALLNKENEDSTEDVENPLDSEKLELDKEKVRNDYLIKMKALKQDMDKHHDQMKAKKTDQSIARIKKKTTK